MEKEILSMEEAAELFGVSIKTFIKLLKEEKVPARKIGREWRFSRSALIEWLSTGDSQSYSSSEGEIKEFFNEVAHEWEEISKNYYDQSIKNKLLEVGLLGKKSVLLDLGCCDGYISRAVAKNVKKVIAVDISKVMLNELIRKASENGIKNIEALESDGRDISLKDNSVDIVCSNMYLHHIEEPNLAIVEMHRVLKPGGIVFLADFKEHQDLDMKSKMHDLWLGFDTEEINIWFKKAGFKNINIEFLEEHSNEKLKIFVLTAFK